jgi:arylsulfatase
MHTLSKVAQPEDLHLLLASQHLELPGSGVGLSQKDPTLARLLKNQGYVTAQFGKNHLGDRDDDLPTNHGFDVFYGNLYHLNAEEEPEHKDWPNEKKYPYMKEIRPRGVIRSSVNDEGKQTIEDTGPLTRERMKTIDMEFLKVTTDFIKNNKSKNAPFFIWFNTTRMHFRTHISEKTKRLAGEWRSSYHDAMIEHDNMIGELLKEVPDDTIIIYTTDNGPHLNTWPDSGTTPFRS